MTEQRHDEIMGNIMKQLDQGDLNLADGITIWHSLGMFLFSNIDQENKDQAKVYKLIQDYLGDMQNMRAAKK